MKPRLLTKLLGSRSKLEVLRCLHAESGGLSGREIARRCGLSHQIVHKALREFESEGIVLRTVAPPTHLFRLNEKHWFVTQVVVHLFEKERGWQADLESLVSEGAPKETASLILFGSFVAGELRPNSDIDVLALVKDDRDLTPARDHLARAGERVYEAFRHPLSPVVLTLAEFGRRYRAGEKFAKEIAYKGKAIHGLLLTEVLHGYGGKKD